MSQDSPENNPEEVRTENTNPHDSKTFQKILFELSNKRRELAIEQEQFLHSRIAHWFTLVTGIYTALFFNSFGTIKCSDFGIRLCFYCFFLVTAWLSASGASLCLFNSERIRGIKQGALMRRWIDWANENKSIADFDDVFIKEFSQDAAKDEEEWSNLYGIRMKWLKRAQYCTLVSLISLLSIIFLKL